MIDMLEMTLEDLQAPAEAPAEDLVRILLQACEVAATVNPGTLGAWTPGGRLLVGLADIARSATRQLAGVAGTSVGAAAGIVVVRDLAASTRALAAASSARSGWCDVDLLLHARALLGVLSDMLSPAA